MSRITIMFDRYYLYFIVITHSQCMLVFGLNATCVLGEQDESRARGGEA